MEDINDNEVIDEIGEVEVTIDKLSAVLTIYPPLNGGKEISYTDIEMTLNSKKINYGRDEEAIKNALKEKEYNKEYVIAKGKPPVNDIPGRLEFKFNSELDIKPKINEDGTVDFRNLNLIEMVKRDQQLVKLIKPIKGEKGIDVFGKKIRSAVGKRIILPRGKNTHISEDGIYLLSSVEGQVMYENDKVNVYETYEVPANVDNSTGNIDFTGNVKVKGNVLTGFSIKAGGNVDIEGSVEGASIEAGGNVTLVRGMQGMDKGVIKCDGNIVAKFIQNATVEASGDISADTIMHSKVSCGGSVVVSGKKGLLVGGEIRATDKVDAKVIGSTMSTATSIEVGIDPNVVKRHNKVQGDIKKHTDEIDKTEKIINLLNKKKLVSGLEPDKQEMLVKSIRIKIQLSKELNDLIKELEELEALFDKKDSGIIKVYNVMYPGVKLVIGNAGKYIKEEYKYSSFKKDRADIRIGSYD